MPDKRYSTSQVYSSYSYKNALQQQVGQFPKFKNSITSTCLLHQRYAILPAVYCAEHLYHIHKRYCIAIAWHRCRVSYLTHKANALVIPLKLIFKRYLHMAIHMPNAKAQAVIIPLI